MHTILSELLPTHSYFRLNPYLTENVLLDDSHPDKLRQLKADARMYLRKNAFKMGRAVTELNRQRRRYQRLGDWIQLKRDSHGL